MAGEPIDLERTRARWRTRRRMTWIALFALLAIAAACFAVPDAVAKTEAVLIALAVSFGGIIGSYFGFATQDDVRLLGPYASREADRGL